MKMRFTAGVVLAGPAYSGDDVYQFLGRFMGDGKQFLLDRGISKLPICTIYSDLESCASYEEHGLLTAESIRGGETVRDAYGQKFPPSANFLLARTELGKRSRKVRLETFVLVA